MKTNDLENELGLSKHTIRYYEKEGFINPERDENGYRNYKDEEVQILKVVKFLRNLGISIDDVKAIVNGDLDFHECLRVNQIHLDKQIEGMKEVKQTIDEYVKKEIPLIPALAEINKKSSGMKLGFQKTTNTVSLGRKLTKEWARRQLLYNTGSALALSFLMGRFFLAADRGLIILWLVMVIILDVLFIAFAYKQTAPMLLDNSIDQSVEFLSEGIRYYKFTGPISHIKYFIAALLGKDEKFMHYYRYEDIKQVEIIAKRRYMNLGSPLAYEVYVSDFAFEFNDGEKFYFLWPMILDDDSRFIATILQAKKININDPDHILYAMENGINLNDYLIGK